MQHIPLAAPGPRPPGNQTFLDGLSLARARAHEATGPARRTFAMLLARATTGPVFWVHPGWQPSRPHAPGMVAFADPGRFTFVRADRPPDILWVLEEVMRAGVVPLVVGDLPAPPGLTPVRRLHLAGEAGRAAAGRGPIALLLTPQGNSPGVESRWHMRPAHGPAPEREGWHLTRSRARMAPEQSWQVTRRGQRFFCEKPVFSPAG